MKSVSSVKDLIFLFSDVGEHKYDLMKSDENIFDEKTSYILKYSTSTFTILNTHIYINTLI